MSILLLILYEIFDKDLFKRSTVHFHFANQLSGSMSGFGGMTHPVLWLDQICGKPL